MKIRKYLVVSILLFLLCITMVKAEDDKTCSYTNLANAKKIASKVTTSYEIKYNGNNPYFSISIYNMTEDLIIGIQSNLEGSKTKYIIYNDTRDGVYTFENYNIDTIEKYKIIVSSAKYDCSSPLRTISFIKPKRNAVHDNPECEYKETINSFYCSEWLTKDLAYSYETVIKKLKEQRINEQNKTSTKPVEPTTREIIIRRIKGITLIIIIVLLVAIVIDFIMIILNIIKIKKEDEF